jgi:hypothetical protein
VGSSTWTADYATDVIFSVDSMRVPLQEEIDVLIMFAFSEPFNQQLITSLHQDLPSSNPFSTLFRTTQSNQSHSCRPAWFMARRAMNFA